MSFYSSYNPTEKKIEQFLSLEKGWHHGEGVKFSKEVVNTALALNAGLYNSFFFETDAFPGFDGEIMLTVYERSGIYFEITVFSVDKFSLLLEKDDETVEERDALTFEELNVIFNRIKRWRSSGYSAAFTSIADKGSSRALPLRIHRSSVVAGYLLSGYNAQSKKAVAYARISGTITQRR